MGKRLFPLESRDSELCVAVRNLGSLKRFWNALVVAYRFQDWKVIDDAVIQAQQVPALGAPLCRNE